MQFGCDWRKSYGAVEFAQDFNMTFCGPGFYLTETDTILVIPNPPENHVTPESIWAVKQPPGTLYDVHVWNTPLKELALQWLTTAPVRHDVGDVKIRKKESKSIRNEFALKAWQRAKAMLAGATRELEAGNLVEARVGINRALSEIEVSERHVKK